MSADPPPGPSGRDRAVPSRDPATQDEPVPAALIRLQAAGLRPTRQRLALARLIYGQGDRHFSADQLARDAAEAGLPVALATVYNTLNQLAQAGALRVVSLGQDRTWYDTNLDHHYHLLYEDGHVEDIAAGSLPPGTLPPVPDDHELTGVDVVLRVRRRR